MRHVRRLPDQRAQMSESAVVNGTRITMGLLRRLDAVIAATLCGAAVAPISSASWCAESSCRSLPDAAQFYGLGIATMAIAATAFWRIRPWPLRIVVLVAALYATYPIPRWTERHGRWTVHLDSRSCAVHAGVTRGEIRRKCGGPSYICHGPKYVDSDLWNPFSGVVCGFSGDVYIDRIVTYNCEGRVANVTGFDTGRAGDSRPGQCVTWGPPDDSR
jgi:hypothetical protein